jgi:hypothetical protein
MTTDPTLVLTLIRTPEEIAGARLLIDSLRDFGGDLRHAPVWVFEAQPETAPCGGLEGAGVRVLPLALPETTPRYYYADKVYAAAQAEAQTPSGTETLLWIDPTCVIVQPPLGFNLDPAVDAAVRPVHIKNVGLPATAPLDDFWQPVYAAVGVADVATTVETFIGAQRIRAYFNSHAFAVRPALGLLRRWWIEFETLIRDEAYQARACQETLHQVFLHQAVLSALLATEIAPARLRRLPPDYTYPYNLHASVPPARQAAALNDLVCFTYEGRPIDPAQVDDVAIREPLRSWLAAHVPG